MSTDNSPDEEQPRPRRRRQVTVVSVAAAVLLAGGGAFWASSAVGGGSDSTGDEANPPPLALDGKAVWARGGEEVPKSPVTYRADGDLPEGPDSAPVHRPGTKAEKSEVAQLAKLFKVDGSPEKKNGGWQVGEPGEGPTLRVHEGEWTFSAGGKDGTRDCAMPLPRPKPSSAEPRSDSGNASAAPLPSAEIDSAKSERSAEGEGSRADGENPKATTLPVPEDGSAECSSPEKGDKDDQQAPSAEKAKKAVQPLLDGLDLESDELTADSQLGSARLVSTAPKVDDLPTHGWNSTFVVNGEGEPVRGSGPLADVTKGAEYPVISAKQALKHLNEGRGQAPVAIECTAVTPEGSGSPAGTSSSDCRKPASGGTTKVKGAEFGLASHYSEGKRVLVPSWLFEVEREKGEKTSRVTHPAVAPKFLTEPSDGQKGDPDPGADGGTSEPGAPPKEQPVEKPSSATDKPAPGDGSDGQGGPGAGGSDAAQPQPPKKYSSKGRTLKVTFWAGVCDDYKARVSESDDSVKVLVSPEKKESNKVCVKMAKQRSVTVTLDDPVGDRKVVDARTGKTLPGD